MRVAPNNFYRASATRCAVGIGMVILFAGVGLPLGLLRADESKVATTSNPHWTPNGCAQCHIPSQPPEAANHLKITADCLACHDGKHASAEKHPVGRIFGSAQIRKPEGWPAPDNVLGCLTCHDVAQACDRSRQRPAHNAEFLRGKITSDPVTFCANCHIDGSSHARRNPHVIIDSTGLVSRDACYYCHQSEVSMDRSGTRTHRAALIANELSICLGCHTRHMDFFEPGHVGATMDEAKYAMNSDLPLGKNSRITCSTCHNPHGAGWFVDNSTLARGALTDFSKNDAMKLRGFGNNLCGACHEQ